MTRRSPSRRWRTTLGTPVHLEALVHRPSLGALGAILVAAWLATSCTSAKPGQSDSPYPPLAELRAEPAATIAPEGATQIREVGAERFMNITGPQTAFYGHVWGSQLTIDETFSFYSAQLGRLGWTPDFRPILSSGESRGWGWCKPSMFFRLTIFDPADYDITGVKDGSAYRVVFDARINGTTRTCPYSPSPIPSSLPTSRP